MIQNGMPVLAWIAFILVNLYLSTIIFKLNRIERKVNRLIEGPPEFSGLVRELAKDPARKIEAIRTLREETGLGLAEAKRIVEELARNG